VFFLEACFFLSESSLGKSLVHFTDPEKKGLKKGYVLVMGLLFLFAAVS